MASRDEDFGADLAPTEGSDAIWSPSGSAVARDWRSLYEQEHARAERERSRADAAEARCEELRWAEVAARTDAGSWKSRFRKCRSKLTEAEQETKDLRRAWKEMPSLHVELSCLERLLYEADVASSESSTIEALGNAVLRLRMAVSTSEPRESKSRSRSGATRQVGTLPESPQGLKDTIQWLRTELGRLRNENTKLQAASEAREHRIGFLEHEARQARKDLEREEAHKDTIRMLSRENIELRSERRRLQDQRDTVRRLSSDLYRVNIALEVSETRNGRLKAKLAKVIAEKKTSSRPIAGTQLRVVLRRSWRQKQTIKSQSKEIRRLRGAVRASEAKKGILTAKIAKLIRAGKTHSKPIAGPQLRVALRRSWRQKQTIKSQSKEIRRLRRAVRASEAAKAQAARHRAARETLTRALSDRTAELRVALRRSRRQKNTIRALLKGLRRLRKNAKASQGRIEKLEMQYAKLRASAAVLQKALFGSRSEQQEKPRSERKRGQQPGAPGHGRTQRPALEEKKEERNPPRNARVCSSCGKPYAMNGERSSTIIEIAVKAHTRRIVRPRWRRGCGCTSSPLEVIAPPVPRLFPRTPYGTSVWASVLFERYACLRPLHRVSAWMSDQGLPISPGTLADSVPRFLPLFERLDQAIRTRQNTAAVRHGDETGWRVQSLSEADRTSRAWLWTSVSDDAVYFHIDPSRNAKVAHRLFGATTCTLFLVCDRLSTYKTMARELDGAVILCWCWAHQRRDFIHGAAGQPRLTHWCQKWIEHIASIYKLNEARLAHYDPALERQTAAFAVAQAALEAEVERLFAHAEQELDALPAGARETKALRSLLNHRGGLSVFVNEPQVPMDNNAAERALRGPVIGRRLSFGSDSETGARFTALMYSVVATLATNGIDVRRWLEAWLRACAENRGRPPDDPSPWLPWSMSEERRRALMAPG